MWIWLGFEISDGKESFYGFVFNLSLFRVFGISFGFFDLKGNNKDRFMEVK